MKEKYINLYYIEKDEYIAQEATLCHTLTGRSPLLVTRWGTTLYYGSREYKFGN
jgi:hypothetical protein